ncbi:MAG: LLM class flavin-dependent oxidoreductase [Candidatus Dormibacteraceae bacterium]
MPDYGHPLRFGTFVTPSAANPGAAVELAQLSEELGYDLVSFQDHPYLPTFLDTWTLLTWVAAETSKIHVAPNVLNVPLRPPAVTARQAISLDLLSKGRFDLALGAGGFWDAIEAMGARRLTPGQSVEALEEAIDVIRGIWDTGTQRVLHAGGTYHRVDGAKRGPAATRDIPIWLGAYKPRMLRLTGRRADGWLPTQSYLQDGDLARGNATIDRAATGAGRDPREIRRLLNISSPADGQLDRWVEDLRRLALEDGISTFIVVGDDPRLLRHFAEETGPALRDAVAAERRARGTELAPTRNRAALQRRVAGIDYEHLPRSLAETAVEPGDAAYSQVRSTYLRGGAPGLVLRPRTVGEVREALAFAHRQPDLPLGVRSGGHGLSGRSTNRGGLVLDLKALHQIEVLDERTRRVRIGPGARWADVARALEPHGWALTSGDFGGVGVGGLATAGGVGWFAREHGLTIDHLRAADLLLADGTLLHASEEENADLFWAIRGAGANFGVVVAFEFEADELGHDIGFARLILDASDMGGVLERWGRAVEAAPRDLTSSIIVTSARGGRPPLAIVSAVVDADQPETVVERLQPLVVAGLYEQSVTLRSYASLMSDSVSDAPQGGFGEPHGRSGLIAHVTPEVAAAAERGVRSGAIYWFQLRAVGGRVAEVPADATSYAHRSANFSIVALAANDEALEEAWAPIRRHLDGLYLSFETSLHPDRIGDAFPPATLARLRLLKQRYDPENRFRDNFNVAGADEPSRLAG